MSVGRLYRPYGVNAAWLSMDECGKGGMMVTDEERIEAWAHEYV